MWGLVTYPNWRGATTPIALGQVTPGFNILVFLERGEILSQWSCYIVEEGNDGSNTECSSDSHHYDKEHGWQKARWQNAKEQWFVKNVDWNFKWLRIGRT